MPALLHFTPARNLKGSLLVGLDFYRDTRSLYNPIASVKHSLRYAYSVFDPKPPPPGPGLDVAGVETGAQGFALYGTVRVSGTNVVPPC